MARKRNREINIFNIAFLDVITGAMGAFVLMVMLLAPYYTGAVVTSPHVDAAQRAVQKAERDINQALRAGVDPRELERLKKLLAAALATLKRAENEITALKYQLNQLEAQNARLTALDAKQQREIAQLKTQIADLKSKLALTATALAAAVKQINNLKQLVSQQKQQIADLNSKLNTTTAALKKAQQKIADLNKTVEQQKQQITALKTQLDQATAALQQMKSKLAEATAKLKQAQSKLAEAMAKLKQARSKLAKTMAELKQAKQDIDHLKSQLAQARTTIKAKNQKIQSQARQIQYLEEHQGTKPSWPLVIQTSWPCRALGLDVYALGTYQLRTMPEVMAQLRAEHKPPNGENIRRLLQAADKPFDPAVDPKQLVAAPDVKYYKREIDVAQVLSMAPTFKHVIPIEIHNDMQAGRPVGRLGLISHLGQKPVTPVSYINQLIFGANKIVQFSPNASWMFLHGGTLRTLRIFLVLRHPLAIPADDARHAHCPITTVVTTPSANVVFTAPEPPSSQLPIQLIATIKLDGTGKLDTGDPFAPHAPPPTTLAQVVQNLSPAEKAAVGKWTTAHHDELHAFNTIKQGQPLSAKATQAVKAALLFDGLALSRMSSASSNAIANNTQQLLNAIENMQGQRPGTTK